ncbi:GTPase-activating gyp10 [Hyphodiscus hymeniophilus]|uniref:GTPase-activating gyp10 n=1 Tax=Hyphodiscus hymeniophilus TaxID=353542 RepID=A0A9P7AXR9_9HELO|nr:GTPase-activating gyp10 [Hyphodiscus hymeniophilus]
MEPKGKLPEETENFAGGLLRPSSLSPEQEKQDAKAVAILEACRWKDVEALRRLATSQGGLVSDEVRRQASRVGAACPNIVMKIKYSWTSTDPLYITLTARHLPPSVTYHNPLTCHRTDQSSSDLLLRKGELSNLIIEVLRRQPYLCYFQGYHDICQVFLLVLSPLDRAAAVARLSTLRIRDFMLPTLAPALAQLRLIPAILYAANPRLCTHLSQTQPFFALSGTLTMYAHDIQEYGDIARLFDVFLARESVFSVYMFAQIVLQRSGELFETPADEPEMLHSILSKLPTPLDLETLIENTATLIEMHPPSTLMTWRSISQYSVLKTSSYPDQTSNQTLEDGETYFNRQVKELQWTEQREKILTTIWTYRRPAGAAGLAMLVGVLSFWLRKSSGPSGLYGAIWRYLSGYQGH